MLALVERYFENIRTARDRAAIVQLLKALSAELGFRSGFVIEYPTKEHPGANVIDTNISREGWWERYIKSGVRQGMAEARQQLANGGIQRVDLREHADSADPYVQFAEKADLIRTTVVPVRHYEDLSGLVGFSGMPELSGEQEQALLLIGHAIYMQAREMRMEGVYVPKASLTPRECEVMDLAAVGMTSSEIAMELGMSARTVNQHVENVAQKLGTKNRVQTVAEAIRHRLLR